MGCPGEVMDPLPGDSRRFNMVHGCPLTPSIQEKAPRVSALFLLSSHLKGSKKARPPDPLRGVLGGSPVNRPHRLQAARVVEPNP